MRDRTKLIICACLLVSTVSHRVDYVFAEGLTAKEKREVDNTAINKRDRDLNTQTADTQNMSKSDTELIAKIREAIVEQDELSVNAQNVKIIAEQGKVTLRGPVETLAEKEAVAKAAMQIAGISNVTNNLEVKKAG